MNSTIVKLQALSQVIAQRSEIIVIFVVIGIIFMMILPLPTGLVDSLIALNISVSALMVVMAMYMPGPLAFSTFPALLLVTTLFRMGLSITTTRLILLQGDAGAIVEAFGSFVVGGNLVVGLVIFLILTIVNFMVITKGSERVAEVSARFTLDAMPGKQMSIDSDLRAGLIDAGTAQKKRGDVGRESQLFGAMDGAMKFVKGDAVAGIIIVMVNILGGFSIGVSQLGLPAGEAIKVYSTLTIGDGLVAQIPALLISLTAGMIITRVSDANSGVSNIGQDMAGELASEPKAWIIAAFVMLGFSLVPGMPMFSFILFALFFGACGTFQIYVKKHQLVAQNAMAAAAASADGMSESGDATDTGDDDVKTFLPYEKMAFITHPATADDKNRLETIRAIRRVRNKLVMDKGYTMPSIDLKPDKSLAENAFKILVYGVPRLHGSFVSNRLAVKKEFFSKSLANALTDKFTMGEAEYSEQNIVWIDSDQETLLKENKIPYATNEEFIAEKVTEIFLKEVHQFIGIEETTKIMGWITTEFPSLGQEIQRILSLTQMAEILQNLATENISIRSVRKVVELIAETAPNERDTKNIVELVRVGLKEQICDELATSNTIKAVLFEKTLEDQLRSARRDTHQGPIIAINQDDNRKLVNSIQKEISKQEGNNIALVVAQDIRRSIREILKSDLFGLSILSYPELTDNVKIVPVARISL